MPLVLTAPTWITVGPTNYWNRADGTTNFCGPTVAHRLARSSNAGVVHHRAAGQIGARCIVPKRLGNWYVKAGARYYHIINDALLAAQEFTGRQRRVRLRTFPNTHRDVGVVYAGMGFGF